jgi:E1A/CREB-binding protein
MLTTTSAKLSLTSLVAYLRETLPRERHTALDAVCAELNSIGAPIAGGIQQRLWEVAGKEAVQAAILHLVQAPSALQASAPIPTDAEPELPPATARSEGLPHLGHELAHAAACTDPACGQPNCQRMKAKLFKLSSHAASCTEAKCTPCSIWDALCRQRDRVGHDAVCAPAAAEIKLEKEPAAADSFAIGSAEDSAGASASGAAPAAEPAADCACRDGACRDGACRDGACRDGACRDGACRDGACRDAGADAAPSAASTFDDEPPEKHTARRELLAHVFTCLQPSCSYPRCARLRRRLHTLVPHASTCTLARCEQCEIWRAYNDCLARTFAAQQEALCGGTLSPHALSTLAGNGGAAVGACGTFGVLAGGEDLAPSRAPSRAPSLKRSLSASYLGSAQLGAQLGAHSGGGTMSSNFAQYSTMCLLWEVLHPAPKPEGGCTEGGGTYCVPGCRRGRLDDGSVMIGCDVCDGWYHPGCLMHPPENADDPFVCPICVEGKAESLPLEHAL